jgi:hypothetical protein
MELECSRVHGTVFHSLLVLSRQMCRCVHYSQDWFRNDKTCEDFCYQLGNSFSLWVELETECVCDPVCGYHYYMQKTLFQARRFSCMCGRAQSGTHMTDYGVHILKYISYG